MKTKLFLVFFLLILLTVQLPKKTYTKEKTAGTSATLINPSGYEARDNRAKILEDFLEKYDSPLKDSAQAFITEADTYNIDWKLLPAISGVESTFAHAEPSGCNNAWGYNIYGKIGRAHV